MSHNEIRLLSAAAVDFEKLHDLLVHAFSYTDGVSPTIPSPREIERKYMTPSGTSYVAVYEEYGEYVAANGALHIPLVGPRGRYPAWMSCDTATRTSHRGKGLFLGCIDAIRAGLPDQPVFFGFPNPASLGGFRKVGWTEKRNLPLWASIVGPGSKDTSEWDSNRQLPNDTSTPRALGIGKTAEYLNWRYPNLEGTYTTLSDTSVDAEFFLVTRQMQFSGQPATLILDLLYTSGGGYVRGLTAARRIARASGSRLLITSPQPHEIRAIIRRGFLKGPERLNPRPLRFMGQGLGPASHIIWNGPWSVSLGDWDAL